MEENENKIKFRSLTVDEIECRIGRVTKGGVSILLYKNARADQQILDESVGPLNWQKHYCRDNHNCIISIYDKEKGQWIEKEDVGTESYSEKEKGLASDSFKRASVCWGIGRELYTAPNIFIGKDKLKNFIPDKDSFKCTDGFYVKEITYDPADSKKILSVVIGITEWGKEYAAYRFSNKPKTAGSTVPTTNQTAPVAKPATTTAPPSTPAASPNQKTPAAPDTTAGLLADDEIILIGNCKGKKYGDVKNTQNFKAFVGWAKKTSTSYPDEAQNDQLHRIKQL